MSKMFYKCKSLKHIDITFDFTNVRNIKEMFSECTSLEDLDVSGIDFRNVEEIDRLFYGCSKLKSLHVSEIKIRTKEYKELFDGCEELEIPTVIEE